MKYHTLKHKTTQFVSKEELILFELLKYFIWTYARRKLKRLWSIMCVFFELAFWHFFVALKLIGNYIQKIFPWHTLFGQCYNPKGNIKHKKNNNESYHSNQVNQFCRFNVFLVISIESFNIIICLSCLFIGGTTCVRSVFSQPSISLSK